MNTDIRGRDSDATRMYTAEIDKCLSTDGYDTDSPNAMGIWHKHDMGSRNETRTWYRRDKDAIRTQSGLQMGGLGPKNNNWDAISVKFDITDIGFTFEDSVGL